MENTPTRIAILPAPGMGHLTPLVQFAKKLLSRHNFSTTLIIPNLGPLSTAQKTLLSDLPSPIDYILLPPVKLDDLPNGSMVNTIISVTIARSLPSIRDAIGIDKYAAFVVDLFGADALDVAKELKIPSYIFFPSTAMSLSFFLYLPKLDETVSCEYRDVTEKLQIPGCVPIHGKDLLDPVQDRKSDAYRWILRHAKKYRAAEGIMVNSFKDLEPGAIEYLQEKETGKPIVYPIGPLIQTGSISKPDESSSSSSICLKWLDEQPKSSVLYVSFGSGGTLSHDQVIEISLGLEMSGQRFLFVTRCPNEASSNATFFYIKNSSDDPLAYLPEGFLERTKGLGLVVPNWAPQAKILAHGSVSGFLTHCGWNSTLESIVNGVPLIAWPLYAEQKMNAVMLHEDAKVALRPKFGENGLVGRVEICNVVRDLTEGEEGKGIRSRMRGLKDAAARVLSENGSSTKLLDELAAKWKSNANAQPL